MQSSLARCPLFRFDTGSDPQRLFAEVAPRVEALRRKEHVSRSRTMLTLATLPSVLEEIDTADDDPHHTLLKCSLYFLLHAGRDYRSTEDYAAAVLKNFWQVLLESREHAEVRRFTRQYAIWCQDVLLRCGLAEEEAVSSAPPGAGKRGPAKPGAAFRMRASTFFTAWVKPGV